MDGGVPKQSLWGKEKGGDVRLGEAGVTRGRFFSPISALLRCDERTVPAVPPPQRNEKKSVTHPFNLYGPPPTEARVV